MYFQLCGITVDGYEEGPGLERAGLGVGSEECKTCTTVLPNLYCRGVFYISPSSPSLEVLLIMAGSLRGGSIR